MKSQKTGQEKFAESSRIFSGAIKFGSQSRQMLLCLSHFSTQFNQIRGLTAGRETDELASINDAAKKKTLRKKEVSCRTNSRNAELSESKTTD